jgi:dTDP-4-amino-4,6-dideoxygalactose transaminase
MAAAVRERVEHVFESQHFVLGPEVAALEHNLARYCEVPYAVGVASGTDALYLGLLALGIGPGHEVITTPFTFFATASTIIATGAKPVFVDIDPDTCLLDPVKVEEAVTHNTRAIVPVHLFGQCVDMDALKKTAKAMGLYILEDACQAIGARYRGRPACSLGDAGALSFYPSKNLGGAGDGGMFLTANKELAEKVQRLHVYGHYLEYGRQYIGTNSRLDSLQAAVLLAKLPYLDHWTQLRIAHARQYHERFRGSSVRPLQKLPHRLHVYNNYVIRALRREELVAYLERRGIGSRIYYPEPLHKVSCFEHYVGKVSLPAAEEAARLCLAIPCYPEMSEAMVDEVAETVLKFYGEA